MVPLKTPDVLACLKAVDAARRPQTQIHLFGVTRCDLAAQFAGYGMTSFDSTSPFKQAFMDDKDNYHGVGRNYVALRVPQVDKNPKLKKRILAKRCRRPMPSNGSESASTASPPTVARRTRSTRS